MNGVSPASAIAGDALPAVAALPVGADSFAPFGRVLVLAAPDDAGAGARADTVLTEGAGWTDAHTRETVIRETPSLGMTSAPGPPFMSSVMERHENVEEALLPAASALVLAVAPPTEGDAPSARDVRAFIIPQGTVVVLDPGVWHDACRGVDGPTSYYWLASCAESGSSPWTPIEGGPVDVRVAA